MTKLYNLAGMLTATTGTGDITLSSVIDAGYLSFSSAGVSNGETITYSIVDGTSSGGVFTPTNSEIGHGVYTSGVLTRSVLSSTNSGSPISLSGNARVYITPAASDFKSFGSIAVSGQDTVLPLEVGDTLTLVAGSNVTLTTDDAARTVTVAASGGGGSSAWGGITGTLSDQTDLQSALDAKLAVSAASETIDDRVAALLTAGTNITLTYNDAAGTLTVDAAGGGVSDGDKGDITVSSGGTVYTIDAGVVTESKLADISVSTAKVQDGAVTDAKLANMAANTVKVRSGSTSGVPSNMALSASQLVGRGSTGEVAAISLGTGLAMSGATLSVSSSPAPSAPQGRLTLTTATPVLTSTVTAATTVYYTPYVGQYVPIYNGSSWAMTDTGGELSQATTDTTKSPAACTTNSNYDLFVWSDSGTMRCTRGPAWTSDTARGTGVGTTELETLNGYLVNKIAITNGPAAQRGTYVGTIRTNGSSQVDYKFGSSAAGGGEGWFGVWNMHNRVQIVSQTQDSTVSWTYTTASWRNADGSATNRCSFVRGLNEEGVYASYSGLSLSTSSAQQSGIGIALDGTTPSGTTGTCFFSSISNAQINQTAAYGGIPGLGWHYIQAVENGATNVTFNGNNGKTIGGLVVSLKG